MKCVNCGTELEEGTKFCGNCGSPVESGEPIVAETPVTETVEPVVEEQPTFSSEVSTTGEERQEIVQEPIPVDTPEFKEQQAQGKKSSGAVKYILIAIIILAIVGAGLFALMKFSGKKSESYEKSVETVQKSMKNLAKEDISSLTVKAKLEVEIKDSLSLTIGAGVEFAEVNDAYKLHARLDKNPETDQLDFYAEFDETKMTVYVPVALLELFGEDMDLGTGIDYLKYEGSFEELGIDFDDLKAETATGDEDLDLTKVLTEDNFKYIGTVDGLKKYTLKVDKNFFNKYKAELKENGITDEDLEMFEDIKFDLNFYVDSSETLSKLELDLTEALKEQDFNKALLTIELSNINSTVVEIPASVKSKSFDINQYQQAFQTETEALPQTTKLF